MLIWPFVFVDIIPPRSSTSGRMRRCMLSILEYAKKHNEVPQNLDAILQEPDSERAITDAWGRILVYSVSPDDTVTLTSYGEDGTEGGEGTNADIIGIFPLKTASGRWEGSYCQWIKRPLD